MLVSGHGMKNKAVGLTLGNQSLRNGESEVICKSGALTSTQFDLQ